MASIILDIVSALILLIFIKFGIKKGGAKSILELLSFVVTIIAVILFKDVVTAACLKLEIVQNWISNLTEFLKAKAIEIASFASVFGSSPADIATNLVSIIINAAGFVITYLIVRLAFKILIKITDLIASLPLLKSANRLIGAIVGGIKGCIFIWLIMAVLLLFTATDFFSDFTSAVADSYLTKALYNHNILFNLFK